jgi:hypothetical protein
MRGLGDVTRRVGKPPVWSGNRCSEVGLLCGINDAAVLCASTRPHDHDPQPATTVIRSNFIRN